MNTFTEREIVHRRHYRPEVQGHVIYIGSFDGRVMVHWDINRPKNHAFFSDALNPASLVSDGFYEEPSYLKDVETPDLSPQARENIIRDAEEIDPELLEILTHRGARPMSDDWDEYYRALMTIRIARYHYLTGGSNV